MVISRRPSCIEGYAIVSEDGMLANSAGVMPDSLKIKADQEFFERGLDGVDVVVHGRHSHEHQRHSDLRRRLILTRRIAALAPDPSNKKALFWNPAGVSLEQAFRYSQYRQGLFKTYASRISKKSFFVIGVWRQGSNSTRQNQASPQIRMSLMLMRMASVHDNVHAIKTFFKKFLISLNLEGVRHHAC